MSPSWPNKGRKWAQDGLKSGPKRAQEWPPRGPKAGPEGPQGKLAARQQPKPKREPSRFREWPAHGPPRRAGDRKIDPKLDPKVRPKCDKKSSLKLFEKGPPKRAPRRRTLEPWRVKKQPWLQPGTLFQRSFLKEIIGSRLHFGALWGPLGGAREGPKSSRKWV